MDSSIRRRWRQGSACGAMELFSVPVTFLRIHLGMRVPFCTRMPLFVHGAGTKPDPQESQIGHQRARQRSKSQPLTSR